jgi:hypothetical protein
MMEDGRWKTAFDSYFQSLKTLSPKSIIHHPIESRMAVLLIAAHIAQLGTDGSGCIFI